MQKLKVYISSTFRDLQNLRKDIIKYINWERQEFYHFTTLMEMMTGDGTDKTNLEVCLENVRRADIYILLFGKRYGSSPEFYKVGGEDKPNTENKSFTEFEYDCARETYKIKRYRYFHVRLSEEYIKSLNDGDSFSDLEDSDKNEGYKRFEERLGETNGDTEIKCYEDLQQRLNTILSNTRDEYNSFLKVNIKDRHMIAINRKTQAGFLETHAKEITDGNPKDGQPRSKIISFIIKSRNEIHSDNDKPMLFIDRAKFILSSAANRSKRIIDLNDIISTVETSMLAELLKLHVNSYLEGRDPSMYTIEKFISDAEKEKVQNEFWAFSIDARLGPEAIKDHVTKLTFCLNRINEGLNGVNDFFYKIYVFIFLISTDPAIEIDTSGFKFEYRAFKEPLSDITLGDINDWFDFLVKDIPKALAGDLDPEKKDWFITQLILDRSTFPKSYRECFDNIRFRTNLSENS